MNTFGGRFVKSSVEGKVEVAMSGSGKVQDLRSAKWLRGDSFEGDLGFRILEAEIFFTLAILSVFQAQVVC
jgi:hypothetical protein